jgi:hypothetical protein
VEQRHQALSTTRSSSPLPPSIPVRGVDNLNLLPCAFITVAGDTMNVRPVDTY